MHNYTYRYALFIEYMQNSEVVGHPSIRMHTYPELDEVKRVFRALGEKLFECGELVVYLTYVHTFDISLH